MYSLERLVNGVWLGTCIKSSHWKDLVSRANLEKKHFPVNDYCIRKVSTERGKGKIVYQTNIPKLKTAEPLLFNYTPYVDYVHESLAFSTSLKISDLAQKFKIKYSEARYLAYQLVDLGICEKRIKIGREWLLTPILE